MNPVQSNTAWGLLARSTLRALPFLAILSGQPQGSSPATLEADSLIPILREAGLDPGNPSRQAIDKAGDMLRAKGKKGIWITGPSSLPAASNSSLTITGWDFYSAQARGRRYLDDSGIIVATHVESRETLAATVDELKEPVKGASEPDTRPLPPADIVKPFQVRVRERLESMQWRPGTYLIDVLLDSQSSNRLRIVVPGDGKRAPAPAKGLRPPVSANAKYPNFRKSGASPALPAGLGITLSTPPEIVYKPGSSWALNGSYRLPIPAAFINAPESGDAKATAVVPITLIITGSSLTGPFVVPLRVPAFQQIERGAAEATVTGYFAIDLFALEETSKVPQTFTVWAYSGSERSQPITAKVTSK